jgi:hypothetical protein
LETNIKIHKRNKGVFFHKTPQGFNITQAKSYAMKDISQYIKSGNIDFGEKNYLFREAEILKMPKNEELVVDTKILKKLPCIHNKEILSKSKITFETISKKELLLISTQSSKDTQREWLKFNEILNKNNVRYIYYKEKLINRYEIFWSKTNPYDIIEKKNSYNWKNWYEL